MASGDPVGLIMEVMPPASSAAQPDARAGASSPAESVDVWDFDDTTDEYVDYKVWLTGYDGGGLTLRIAHMASSATSGNFVWQAAIRALPDDTEDLDTTAHTYAFNTVTAAVASAAGEIAYDSITFTNGADMDSWADGEVAIVRVGRKPSDTTNDTATGDAELLGIRIVET